MGEQRKILGSRQGRWIIALTSPLPLPPLHTPGCHRGCGDGGGGGVLALSIRLHQSSAALFI